MLFTAVSESEREWALGSQDWMWVPSLPPLCPPTTTATTCHLKELKRQQAWEIARKGLRGILGRPPAPLEKLEPGLRETAQRGYHPQAGAH